MWWVGWFDGTALYREFFELSNIVFCIVRIYVATRYRQKRVEPQCLCMLGYKNWALHTIVGNFSDNTYFINMRIYSISISRIALYNPYLQLTLNSTNKSEIKPNGKFSLHAQVHSYVNSNTNHNLVTCTRYAK